MSLEYFDRSGEEISFERWVELASDREYKTLRQDAIGNTEISTVWLGLNYEWDPDRPPLIFETMIFSPEPIDCRRYSSEEDALKRHEQLVEELKLLTAAFS